MGKVTPCWWWCSYISQGQSRWQLFFHPRLMPGLLARAILCLGLIKKSNQTKSNQIQAAQRRKRKTETCRQPCVHQTCPPALGTCHPGTHQSHGQPAGGCVSMWWPDGRERKVEQLKQYEERGNWRLESGEEKPVRPSGAMMRSQPELLLKDMSEFMAMQRQGLA